MSLWEVQNGLNRIVIGQEHKILTLAELADTVPCHMNKRHSSLPALASVNYNKIHIHKSTGRNR